MPVLFVCPSAPLNACVPVPTILVSVNVHTLAKRHGPFILPISLVKVAVRFYIFMLCIRYVRHFKILIEEKLCKVLHRAPFLLVVSSLSIITKSVGRIVV